ncbi:MAG: asparagine synthetase B, partial [Planctomycetota bacterium]
FLCYDIEKLGVEKEHNHLAFFEPFQGAPLMINFMAYDLRSYLPDDILVKTDRATMGCALEGREPLLDHKILEFSCRMPLEWKYRHGKSKFLLRKILAKYVPTELFERPKQGFGVPIEKWFHKELSELYRQYLNKERLQKEGILNAGYVENLVQAYFQKQGVNHYKLWLLLMFEMWRERWGRF